MKQENSELNTLTIIKHHGKTSDLYHFATHLNNDCFNQVYLSNLDLLNTFLDYFKDKVNQSKLLSSAYHYTFSPNRKTSKFCLIDPYDHFEKREEIKKMMTLNSPLYPMIMHRETGKTITLAPQQMRCLMLLLSGKTSKEIGMIMNLSPRSVDHYIQRIRSILGCNSRKTVLANYTLFNSEESIY